MNPDVQSVTFGDTKMPVGHAPRKQVKNKKQERRALRHHLQAAPKTTADADESWMKVTQEETKQFELLAPPMNNTKSHATSKALDEVIQAMEQEGSEKEDDLDVEEWQDAEPAKVPWEDGPKICNPQVPKPANRDHPPVH